MEATAPLTSDNVVPLLAPGSLGRAAWVHLPRTDSTNLAAADLARQGALHGTVVVAEEQDAGRGRRGRTWVMPPGTGLAFSVVLRPPLPPRDAFRLTLCAALAVQRVASGMGVAARIKWPNDVVVEDRKLCGVLTELSADSQLIHHAIVGVGLNVTTRMDQFPADVRAIATSLAEQTDRVPPRARVLADVLDEMTTWYGLSVQSFADVLAAARASSATLGRRVRVRDGDDIIEGDAVDLDGDGALVLRTVGGTTRVVSGDVEPC